MSDFKVGDEVRVITHTGYRKSPEGGHRATVVKIGRKYGTATYTRHRTAYPPGPVEETIEFDLTTGRERGSTSNYSTRVKTLEEVALDERRAAADKILFDAGVSIRHRPTLEQVEALAEVVKTWED